VKVLDHDGKLIETGRITKCWPFAASSACGRRGGCGDIVAIAGLPEATVAMTICDPSVETPIRRSPIDPADFGVTFRVNDSPARRHRRQQGHRPHDPGEPAAARGGGQRALRVRESDDKDAMEVAGRGELQLGILIEQMRREGFELSVSAAEGPDARGPRPARCWSRSRKSSSTLTRFIPASSCRKWQSAKAEMLEMKPSGGHRLRLVFHAPTRGLIGYQGELLTDTRGTAIMNRLFHAYGPHKGPIRAAATAC